MCVFSSCVTERQQHVIDSGTCLSKLKDFEALHDTVLEQWTYDPETVEMVPIRRSQHSTHNGSSSLIASRTQL